MLLVVLVIEPAPSAHWDGSNLVIRRSYSEDLAVGRSVGADGTNVFPVQHRRDGAQMLGSVPNSEVVAICEIPCPPRALAAFNCWNSAREAEQDVGAKFLQVFFLSTAEAFAQSDKQQQRANSPRNAKHGEKRPELVRPQRGQGLADDIEKHLHRRFPLPPGRQQGA